jgi:TPR repeat protein/AcrR family transcriptional regulator
VQTFEPEMMSPDRGDARSAILSAARVVAQREGVENLTLAKVASEAALPRPVVFGQFVRKEDLLLCVAADSVVALARKMGGIPEPELQHAFDFSREGAVILTLPRSEAVEENQTVSAVRKAVVAGEMLATGGSERRATRSADAEGVSNEPSAEKSQTRAPDAWLERRLRVFERAMTAMEARQEKVEKDSRAIVVSAEDTIKSLEATISALVARLDAVEVQQKASTDDIRAALSEASLRIQTVEGVARAALVENDVEDFEDAPSEPEPFEPAPVLEVPQEPASSTAKPAFEPVDEPKSFLDAARASAIAAAAAKAEPESAKVTAPRFSVKVAYMVAGLIALAVFIVAAGIAFSQGVRDGRRDALRHTELAAPPSVRVAAASLTELDRLTKLAEAGNADAELAIANRYLDSRGTRYDPLAGMQWMSRAAKQGNAVAQYGLGSLYQKGIGTKPDAVQAMHWYEAAALQGNRKAMHDLAIAYAEGLGGVTSASEAVRWFSRAANLGYVDSQFNLAVLYERGDGVPQSLVDAYKWYAIAGAQGDTESKLRIEALRTQLSTEDLAAAQRAASAFRPQPFEAAANLAPKI